MNLNITDLLALFSDKTTEAVLNDILKQPIKVRDLVILASQPGFTERMMDMEATIVSGQVQSKHLGVRDRQRAASKEYIKWLMKLLKGPAWIHSDTIRDLRQQQTFATPNNHAYALKVLHQNGWITKKGKGRASQFILSKKGVEALKHGEI